MALRTAEQAHEKVRPDADPDLVCLVLRVKAEYLEMPGLRLTIPQMRRLWGVAASTCEAIAETLREQHFLSKTCDGAYVRSCGLESCESRSRNCR